MATLSNAELKCLVKESVKEALEEELIKIRLMFFPEVSENEMHDISTRYGKPEMKSHRKEMLNV